MAQSRKDSRGYALRTGECQRSDGLDPRRAERVTVNQVYDSYMKGKYEWNGFMKFEPEEWDAILGERLDLSEMAQNKIVDNIGG